MITFVSNNFETINVVKRTLGDNYQYMCKDIRSLNDLELDKFDVYISPANSFGELQGGIDMQYYKYFGGDILQENIYNIIRKDYSGEILMGDFCYINLSNGKKLLLCPTMTIPADVSQTRNAYYFMRAVLKGINILKQANINVNNVFCPIPCTGVGKMSSELAAKQMKAAIDGENRMGQIYDVYTGPNSLLTNAKMMVMSMIQQ